MIILRLLRGTFRQEQGSILLFTMFVLLTLSVLCISYWKLIEVYARSIYVKEQQLKAEQVAKSGIEDMLYEIREGVSLNVDSLAGHGWKWVTGNTYLKSTKLGTLNLALFGISSTFSVTVSGNPLESTVNIISIGEVSSTQNTKSFSRRLSTDIIKTSSNEIYIMNMQEL